MGARPGRPSTGLLVVRDAELAVLGGLLVDAAEGLPRFVLVEGEPGVGRTTFLGQFLARLDATCVLSASGDEFETSLRYGVLEQLCRSSEVPRSEPFAMLSDPTATSSEPHVMGSALLAGFCELQRQSPVIVAIDDVHLADTPSQLALLYAFRRLQSERVLAVLSAPVDCATWLVRSLQKLTSGEAGLRLPLPGFCAAEIRELAARLGTRPLSHALVERLREHTTGNPRHIKSLLDEVGIEALDRAGHAPLPVPRSCNAVVRERLAACAWEARRLVAAASVIGMRCDFGLLRRLAALTEPRVALDAAVDARLVDFRERQVSFRHPLARSAVYHSLGIAERAELHGRAAELLGDEASALWHLAAAETEANAELASTIAAFAGNKAIRGELTDAATFFSDAAKLAPAGMPRETYVLDAVECELVRGDVAAAAPLATGLETFGDRARSHYLLGRLARLSGRSDDAERLLNRAEELRPSTQPVLAANVAAELAVLHIQLLRPAVGLDWVETATHVLDGTGIMQRPLPCLALGLVLTGRVPEAVEIFSTFPDPTDDADPKAASLLFGRSIVQLYSGALDHAQGDASRLMLLTGQLGSPVVRVCALALAALTGYRLGAWENAVRHAELGLQIAAEAELGFALSTLHAAAVWPLTGLGRWDSAETHAAMADAGARCPWDRAMAAIARGVLAHGRGCHEDAIDAVKVLRALGPADAIDEPDGFWPWQGLYIDAAMAIGRLDDAAHELERFEVLASARHSVVATIRAARLLGSLESARGRQREAQVAFRRAISLGSVLPRSFDHAVTQSVYGAFLRRIGKRSAAVAELRAGRDGFERLGARPWIKVCDREMAASGLTPRNRRASGQTTLTAQERTVARLVAQGKSNRAVAADLVVSINTVEYHLKNIYAKLGIGSRSQLVLRSVAPPDGAPM